MSSNKDMKVYIAAPFFTVDQLLIVQKIEDVLDDIGIEYFSPRSEGTLKEMSPQERSERMGELFASNCSHMDWCTHAIAVIDDYDTGTVWEMGYLYATKKTIITYSAHYHGINVMLNESILAHCTDLESIVDAIDGRFKDNKTSDVI